MHYTVYVGSKTYNRMKGAEMPIGIIETVIVVRLVYKHRERITQGIENTCEYSLRDVPGESGLTERQVDALLAHKEDTA